MSTGLASSVSAKLADYFGLKRNIAILLLAIVVIGAGEEMWMRFVPKYLKELGAAVWVIGLFDGIKTLLGAIYAYPGGVLADHWGHRRALVSFSVISILGYVLVLLVPHWSAVIAGSFLFLAWTSFSLPATFSLIGASLHANKLAMGIGVQSFIKRLPIIIGPIIGGVLVDRFGVVNGVRIALAITIALSVFALFVQNKIQEAPPTPAPLKGFSHALTQFNPPLRRLLLSDILIRFCERIPFAWVVIYAMDHVGVSGTQAGLLTATEMALSVACLIPAAHLADKYGREPFVIGTFIFFTLFPFTLLFATSFTWLMVAFAVRGLKEFGEPARKALIIACCPETMRGRIVGAYYLVRDLIVTSGAFIGAALWKLSPQMNLWVATGVGAIGTVFYVYSMRRLSVGDGPRPGSKAA